MVHLLGESECEGAVKMSVLSGTRVLKKTSGISVFEDVSFRSNEVLSLLGTLLIELKRYKAQKGDAVRSWEGRDTGRGRGSEIGYFYCKMTSEGYEELFRNYIP